MDFSKIEKIARLMKETGLNEVYYRDEQGEEIKLEIDSEYRGILKGDFISNYFDKLNKNDDFSISDVEKHNCVKSCKNNKQFNQEDIYISGSENNCEASSSLDEGDFDVVASKMIGTFYSKPSPDEDPFVKVGDKVKKGDVIYIIESMKLMNNVKAEYDCEILEILVEDGEVVEFGQELFKVIRK